MAGPFRISQRIWHSIHLQQTTWFLLTIILIIANNGTVVITVIIIRNGKHLQVLICDSLLFFFPLRGIKLNIVTSILNLLSDTINWQNYILINTDLTLTKRWQVKKYLLQKIQRNIFWTDFTNDIISQNCCKSVLKQRNKYTMFYDVTMICLWFIYVLTENFFSIMKGLLNGSIDLKLLQINSKQLEVEAKWCKRKTKRL